MNIVRTGNTTTEINLGGNIILFSYQTPVAAIVDGVVYRTEKHWSQTTSRHINKFLDNHTAIARPQAFFDGLIA